MKRLCCIIFVFVFLCGCESSKPILISSSDFSAIVNVDYKDNSYQYKIIKTANETTFKPCGKTLPIEFNINGETVTANYNENASIYADLLDNSFIIIINQVLNKSQNKEVFSDYNGNYILHETITLGEYSLKLDKSGFPNELNLKTKELYVKFSDVKEVKGK